MRSEILVKQDFLRFAVFRLLLFEKAKLTNHSTYAPEILLVNPLFFLASA